MLKQLQLFALVIAIATAGCVPSLDNNPPREPQIKLPDSYGLMGGKAPSSDHGAKKTWREFFDDPDLRVLLNEAVSNNQELNIQLQEVIIARSEAMARSGEYLPRLSAGLDAGVEKVGRYTSQGASDEATGVAEHLPSLGFGLSASWEVDVWGKLRDAAKAATYRYLSTFEGRNLVMTTIVAEVARTYYELLALDRQLELLEQNIALQQRGVQAVKLVKEAGRTTELAVKRLEAELLKNQSRRYDFRQNIVEAENRINFLVGRLPQPIARRKESLDAPLPASIGLGLPADLLQNRPDVRQAEWALEAAKLDVSSARARFYPSLSIEAKVGYEAFNGKFLVNTPESMLYNLAANLTAPLLNRQAIKAAYFSANATQIQAVYNYERTLVKAYIEVVNNLRLIENLKHSYQLESQQVDTLEEATRISNVLFASARADYNEVLLTRRDALEAKLERVETKLQQRKALVAVYRALGGGWR